MRDRWPVTCRVGGSLISIASARDYERLSFTSNQLKALLIPANSSTTTTTSFPTQNLFTSYTYGASFGRIATHKRNSDWESEQVNTPEFTRKSNPEYLYWRD